MEVPPWCPMARAQSSIGAPGIWLLLTFAISSLKLMPPLHLPSPLCPNWLSSPARPLPTPLILGNTQVLVEVALLPSRQLFLRPCLSPQTSHCLFSSVFWSYTPLPGDAVGLVSERHPRHLGELSEHQGRQTLVTAYAWKVQYLGKKFSFERK